MEAIERNANFGNEFERSVHLIVSTLHGIFSRKPWKVFGGCAKWVATGSAEGMPVGYGKAEMLCHSLFANFFAGIVIPECQGIIRFRPFKLNGFYPFKIFFISDRNFHVINVKIIGT